MDDQQSPTPVRVTEHLDFFDALRAVVDGEHITRVEWGNEDNYGFLDVNTLRIMLDGTKHSWIVSEGDLIGTDWIVL